MSGPIAVIGAGGFVGTRLIESLVLDGDAEIRAIVRAYRSLAGLSRFGSAVTWRIADAENPAALVPALQGASVAVNLTTGPQASIVRSTRSILEACLAAKVPRLIHLSSAVVFGEVASPAIDDDSPPLRRHWMPYARAKAAAEVWLRERLHSTPCQVAVLRPGIVWGVRSPHTLQAVKALWNKNAYLVGRGDGIFNSIYIDNLVACIRACGAHQGPVAGFYNIADRETITWREFYAALASSFDYDMDQMPAVSGEYFPWSTRAVIEYIQLLPGVNGLYHRLKTALPDALKSRLKALLAGSYAYGQAASAYRRNPVVDREVWHLQKVRRKLPTAKFSEHFGFTPPVTFEDGVRRTMAWIEFLGYESLSRQLVRAS
ncbi:MAG TPA: NAD(P)-dependent oxidoreductase [Pirellulales bacterium]|nr:NAD(P)-dependent oxidoreductase [Pirellulales bacterium]